MNKYILPFVLFALFGSCSNKQDNNNSESNSIVSIMKSDFKFINKCELVPDQYSKALRKLIQSDSLWMFNLNEKSKSTTTDQGRQFILLGYNTEYCFIAYNRLACRFGARILIVFKIMDNNIIPFYLGNFDEDVRNLGDIQNLIKNGKVEEIKFTDGIL